MKQRSSRLSSARSRPLRIRNERPFRYQFTIPQHMTRVSVVTDSRARWPSVSGVIRSVAIRRMSG